MSNFEYVPTPSIRISHTEDDELSLDLQDMDINTESHTTPFGFDVWEGEWQITGRWTTRQDGTSSWMVVLTQCDRIMIMRRGTVRIGGVMLAMQRAIFDVTKEAGWITPLNQGT